MTDIPTIRNTRSGDTYELVAVVVEGRESNETVVLHNGDLTGDEWKVRC